MLMIERILFRPETFIFFFFQFQAIIKLFVTQTWKRQRKTIDPINNLSKNEYG